MANILSRSINHPDVEIIEQDRSLIAPTLVGTTVLVTGFADKGIQYSKQYPTSTSDIIAAFGKPTNEAEAYFNSAMNEVVSKGGNLVAIKLPYNNVSDKEILGVGVNMMEQPQDIDCIRDAAVGTNIFHRDYLRNGSTLAMLNGLMEADYITKVVGYNMDTPKHIDMLTKYNTIVENNDIAGDTGFENYTLAIFNERRGTVSGPTYQDGMFVVLFDYINGAIAQHIVDPDKTGEYLAGGINSWAGSNIGDVRMDLVSGMFNTKHVSKFGNSVTTSFGKLEDSLDIFDRPLAGTIRGTSLSEDIARMFPAIGFQTEGSKQVADTSKGRWIGVAVCRTNVSENSENKINVSVVEAFVGALSPNERDISTGQTVFIGDLVNAQSDYIKLYINKGKVNSYVTGWLTDPKVALYGSANFDETNIYNGRTEWDATTPYDHNYILKVENEDGSFDLYQSIIPGTGTNIGNDPRTTSCFFNEDTDDFPNAKWKMIETSVTMVGHPTALMFKTQQSRKLIQGGLIVSQLDIALSKVEDILEDEIDLVVDAGLSTIAQFTDDVEDGTLFDPANDYDFTDAAKLSDSNTPDTWRQVCARFISFCQFTRKDCMVILDAPRHIALVGNSKRLKRTDFDKTFSSEIANQLRYITGLNSSYAALYENWRGVTNKYTGRKMWQPPSIKTVGAYIYTDNIANVWDAPAGLNRGIMSEVNDLAYQPSGKNADVIYTKGINYARFDPLAGFVIEGQKTTQTRSSAFDRVNVRRLFLKLERAAYKVLRYFIYEPNTAATRRNVVAILDPIFSKVEVGGGMYSYKIICDESINTPDVIDNNELRINFMIKPTRTIEYILATFIGMRSGASFEEKV